MGLTTSFPADKKIVVVSLHMAILYLISYISSKDISSVHVDTDDRANIDYVAT